MVGERDAPEVIAQGVVDFDDLPGEGEEREVSVPLVRRNVSGIRLHFRCRGL